MYNSDYRGWNNDLKHLEFKNSYMIPNLVNFLKDSQTDIFWKFYLATIYIWGHLNNDTISKNVIPVLVNFLKDSQTKIFGNFA